MRRRRFASSTPSLVHMSRPRPSSQPVPHPTPSAPSTVAGAAANAASAQVPVTDEVNEYDDL